MGRTREGTLERKAKNCGTEEYREMRSSELSWREWRKREREREKRNRFEGTKKERRKKK